LDHRLRVGLVIEEAPRRHDDGIFLSHQLRAWGNGKRASDAVDTSIEVHHFTRSRGTVDDLLKSRSIICDRIT
jgi:hypothetical protein